MLMLMLSGRGCPSSGDRTGCSRGAEAAALGMAELAEPGGDVPDGESGVGVEDGVDVPQAITGRNGHEWPVAGLPPGPDVLTSLLEGPPQGVGGLLVKAVKCITVNVVPHLGLVDVARPRLLCIPEHLIRHLHARRDPTAA